MAFNYQTAEEYLKTAQGADTGMGFLPLIALALPALGVALPPALSAIGGRGKVTGQLDTNALLNIDQAAVHYQQMYQDGQLIETDAKYCPQDMVCGFDPEDPYKVYWLDNKGYMVPTPDGFFMGGPNLAIWKNPPPPWFGKMSQEEWNLKHQQKVEDKAIQDIKRTQERQALGIKQTQLNIKAAQTNQLAYDYGVDPNIIQSQQPTYAGQLNAERPSLVKKKEEPCFSSVTAFFNCIAKIFGVG